MIDNQFTVLDATQTVACEQPQAPVAGLVNRAQAPQRGMVGKEAPHDAVFDNQNSDASRYPNPAGRVFREADDRRTGISPAESNRVILPARCWKKPRSVPIHKVPRESSYSARTNPLLRPS